MDRLMVLRLEVQGCEAEAQFNGVPLLRATPQQPVVLLPVHEFTLVGGNELVLVLQPGPAGAATPPPPAPQLADGQAFASLRLLLPRLDGVAHPASARSLAQLDWAPAADTVYETPHTLRQAVQLPTAFPRWRWLDAPAVADANAQRPLVAAFLLEIALGLARGNPEPWLQACRLRLEELAAAYQRPLADDVAPPAQPSGPAACTGPEDGAARRRPAAAAAGGRRPLDRLPGRRRQPGPARQPGQRQPAGLAGAGGHRRRALLCASLGARAGRCSPASPGWPALMLAACRHQETGHDRADRGQLQRVAGR